MQMRAAERHARASDGTIAAMNAAAHDPAIPRRRRLSSTIRPRTARWCAIALATGGLAALVAAALDGNAGKALGWLGPLLAAATGVAASVGVLPLAPRDALDGAWVDGDEIVLRRHSQCVRAPLTDIQSVDADRTRNLVYLTLRVPCVLGNQVRFRARPRAAHRACQSLRQRLRAAGGTAC
jgi:hypothetical protein